MVNPLFEEIPNRRFGGYRPENFMTLQDEPHHQRNYGVIIPYKLVSLWL